MVEWTNDSDVIAERKKLDNSFIEEKLKKLVAPPLGSREKKKQPEVLIVHAILIVGTMRVKLWWMHTDVFFSLQ